MRGVKLRTYEFETQDALHQLAEWKTPNTKARMLVGDFSFRFRFSILLVEGVLSVFIDFGFRFGQQSTPEDLTALAAVGQSPNM